jgi:hypothetical protein
LHIGNREAIRSVGYAFPDGAYYRAVFIKPELEPVTVQPLERMMLTS